MNEAYEVFLKDYYKLFDSLFYVYHNCEDESWKEKADEKLDAIIDEVITTVGDNNVSLDDYDTFEEYEVALEKWLEDNNINSLALREEFCGYCFDRW